MKVNVNITVELNPADWDDIFGTGTGKAEIAADVKDDIVNYIYQQNTDRGIPVKVTVNK